MRAALHLLLASVIGLSAMSTAAAQPLQTVPATSDLRVRIRIAPDLDRKHPELRAAINASSGATLGEPAEFELTTDNYLPDFAELRPLAASSDLFRTESVIRIGKLSVGEVPNVLSAVTSLIARQKALAELAARPVSNVHFCKENPLTPGQCLSDEMAEAVGEQLPSLIRNDGPAPRYVALLQTSAAMGIAVVPFSDGGAVIRLDPGKSLLVPPYSASSRGRVQQYLVISDQPFDPRSMAQPNPYETRPDCYAILRGECVAPSAPLSTDPRWTALTFTSHADDGLQPAMGGGFAAARGDADWMVAIFSTVPYTKEEIEADKLLPPDKRQYLAERTADERAHSCGGTIIAPDLVLTAAHCVATGRFKRPNVERVFSDRRVRIGSLRLGKGGETRAIIGVAVHAGYTGERTGIPNDIALLLLKSDERIRLNPRALALATKAEAPSATVTGLGWGYTQAVAPGTNLLRSTTDELQRNPNLLQQAPLEILATSECGRRLPGRIKPGMICLVTPKAIASGSGRATFSCRGDSGGPLVRNYGHNDDELIGLTSWSMGCGFKGTPSVYTDVAYFARWIAAARAEIKPGKAVFVADPARR